MSAVTHPPPPASAQRLRLAPLARIEAMRYARHPLFLTGFALGVLASAGERGPIELDYQVIPAFFVGVLGLVVAARLDNSTRRSAAVIDAAPVSQSTRTAALCVACAVPAAAGVVLVLLHRAFVLADPFPAWMYGTYGASDRIVITMVIPVVACASGPLLGVAVGRWLRFPGAALLAMIVVLMWSATASYLPAQGLGGRSLAARVVHMATPYTAFATGNGSNRTPPSVRSYTGSPSWFAVWTVALGGLAITAALWRGAVGDRRRVVRRAFATLAVSALIALGLSIAFGNHRLYDTSPVRTVTVLLSHDG